MPQEPSQESSGAGSDHLPDRVNVDAPDAAAYWARTFQVSIERVRAAVAAVGHEPEQVAAHLDKPWPNTASGIV